ncbi:MAG: SH3 domain-containing protein [Fastidiosipila sp.]|jgi:3D (Asp-Asp-Asp) domain-containing protein|nr:SH3 domain-containing protein [Fastidiosipila sp.]
MRQKRKIDKILLTTATVLVATVFVALLFRLINDGQARDPEENGPHLTQPAWVAEEGLFNVEGLIDRHHPDNELIFLLDEVQAPVNENTHSPVTSPVTRPKATIRPRKTVPVSMSTETSTPNTTFREVDLRYYVLSESGLNLREGPSTDSPVKQLLEYGQPLRVIALSNDWAKVRLAGYEIGYVAKRYISQYPPATTTTVTTTTTTPATTPQPTTTVAPTTTRKPVDKGQGESSFTFVLSGTPDGIARANFNIIKEGGLINKEISPSINRHYNDFTDNGDGTITVDGLTFGFLDQYGSRYATHYDGVEVCRQQIKARGGTCRQGHTTPTNHNTGSGIPAQRGLIAVGASEIDIFPRGTVLFIKGYGFGVVADRSGGSLDLCYDPDECSLLTRSNSVSAIYVIARP